MSLTKHVPASNDGYTFQYHQYDTVRTATPTGNIGRLRSQLCYPTLRRFANRTDINAMYNAQDMVENKTLSRELVLTIWIIWMSQKLWFQVMFVLTDCPHNVFSDFRNISTDVKQLSRRLRDRVTIKEHCDFMIS